MILNAQGRGNNTRKCSIELGPVKTLMSPKVTVIESGNPAYPALMRAGEVATIPPRIRAIGNLDILRSPLLGFFCSVKCPGNIILKTYDLARTLRGGSRGIIGGFHSPMEREFLLLLLRGTVQVIVCPARSIEKMRIPTEWRKPLAEGRLLVLSPFEESQRRMTAELAEMRNDFVAALADEVFIAYATPGGRTEAFARKVIASGKKVFTLDAHENSRLIDVGAEIHLPNHGNKL